MSYDGSVKFDTKIDTTGLKRDAKTLTSTFASIRDVMMGPIAAGKMIVDVFKKIGQVADQLENAWAAQEEAIALLDATLKSTGADAWTSSKRLQEMASSLQQVTKFGDETITSMQTVLLGFRNITGENFEKATVEILNMATVMKMDLTSAAQAVGKALDNPAQGMDSLSRQGFKFTQQEKEMMKAMQDAGDLAGAQKIILDELAKTYGGAAEAAGATGSAMKVKLQNAIGDLNEELGKLVSEALAPARNWMLALTQSVTAQVTAFSNASAAAKEYGATILSFTGQKMLEGIGAPTTKPAATTFEQIAIVAQNKLSAAQTVNSTRTLESLQKQLVALNALLAMEKDITAEERAAYALKKADVESLIVVRNDQLRLETEYLNTEYAVTQNEIKALQDKIAYYESFTKSTGEEARKRDIVLENLREQLRVLQDIKDAEVEVIGGIEAAPDLISKGQDAASGSGVVKGLGASMINTIAATKEEISLIGTLTGYLDNMFDEAKRDAKDWTNVLNQAQSALDMIVVSGLEEIGKELATGEGSWSDWGTVALRALAQVLESIGYQLAALSVTHALMVDVVGSIAAAAGSVAAFVAAGAIKAWADDLEEAGDSIGYVDGQLDKLEKDLNAFEKSLAEIGSDVGEMFVDNLVKGLSGEDLKYELEEYIRKAIIQSIVYTSSMQEQLAGIGAQIQEAIVSGSTDYSSIISQIPALYNQMESAALTAENILNDAFYGPSQTSALSQGVSLSGDASRSMTTNVNVTGTTSIVLDGEVLARVVTNQQEKVYSNAYGA